MLISPKTPREFGRRNVWFVCIVSPGTAGFSFRFVSFFTAHGEEGGERKPLETGNSNETNALSGRLTRTNFVWNRFEDRTSKVFHHPFPLSPPPPVFSLPFVCIFVDKGACIINEASLEEPLVERIAA